MKRLAAVLLSCAAVVPPASAAGWIPLLKNTPAEVFDDDDLRLFLDTGAKALATDETGATFDWKNPDTGAGGSFRALGTAPSVQGLPCKRLRMSVYAKKRKEVGTSLTACRTAEGKWRLAGVR